MILVGGDDGVGFGFATGAIPLHFHRTVKFLVCDYISEFFQLCFEGCHAVGLLDAKGMQSRDAEGNIQGAARRDQGLCKVGLRAQIEFNEGRALSRCLDIQRHHFALKVSLYADGLKVGGDGSIALKALGVQSFQRNCFGLAGTGSQCCNLVPVTGCTPVAFDVVLERLVGLWGNADHLSRMVPGRSDAKLPEHPQGHLDIGCRSDVALQFQSKSFAQRGGYHQQGRNVLARNAAVNSQRTSLQFSAVDAQRREPFGLYIINLCTQRAQGIDKQGNGALLHAFRTGHYDLLAFLACKECGKEAHRSACRSDIDDASPVVSKTELRGIVVESLQHHPRIVAVADVRELAMVTAQPLHDERPVAEALRCRKPDT